MDAVRHSLSLSETFSDNSYAQISLQFSRHFVSKLDDLVHSILHLLIAVVMICTNVSGTNRFIFFILIHVKCSVCLTFNDFLSEKYIYRVSQEECAKLQESVP